MFIYLFNADGSCKIRQLMNPSDIAAEISKLHGGLDFIQTDGVYTPDDMYFKKGRLVFKTLKPSQFHQFDYTMEQWVDPRSLQELKDAKWEQIKQARAAAIDAPLVTPYGVFDSDAPGRTSITEAVLMANNMTALSLPVEIDFTLADNTSIALNAQQIVTVGLLLGQKVQTAHARSRLLRGQIEIAAASDLELILWE